MNGIFLSHSSKDKIFVNKLADRLKEQNIKVWLDVDEIKIGATLGDVIRSGIANMNYFGIVLSPDSVESNWVKKELKIAKQFEANQDLIVLPILYKDCLMPEFLKSKSHVDFRCDVNFEHSLKRIIDAVAISEFERSLLDLVKNGIKAEFNAYKNLPKLETDELKKYYHKDSSAYYRINNTLINHIKRKWVLNNDENPSIYTLLKTGPPLATDEGKFTIKTIEYFYLRWFSKLENKYKYIYNETNDQIYILTKRNNNWKIDSNIYPPPKKSYHPRSFRDYVKFLLRFFKIR